MKKYFYMVILLLFIYMLTKSKANKLVWWYGEQLSKAYKALFEEE